jgi:uncharacterized membrane protein
MDQVAQFLDPIFRWFHIFWGIVWIGLLYWFNFVNIPFVATLDADTKKKVGMELSPRALYWFRWGAAYTWILGFLLIGLVFDYGNQAVGEASKWTGANHIMLYSFILAPFIYDLLAKQIKDNRVMAVVGFIAIGGVLWLGADVLGYSYRGYIIYTGAMLGSIMAYNVWFRIWPNQKIILNGMKTGNPADPAIVTQTGQRSKHNTYLSLPLIWAMINAHTTKFAGDRYYFLIFVFVGWMAVNGIYKRAGKVKGL